MSDLDSDSDIDPDYKLRRGHLEGRPLAPVLYIVAEMGVLEALTEETRPLAADAEKLKISPSFSHARLVTERVDIDLLENMITGSAKHPKCQELAPSTRYPTNIRLIDTIQHSVAPMDVGRGYVAFSYTWGGDQQFKLLSENVSQWSQPGDNFIKGIYELTVLCITQNDPSTLRSQLEQMDLSMCRVHHYRCCWN